MWTVKRRRMRAWVISTWKQSPRWRFRVLRRSDFKFQECNPLRLFSSPSELHRLVVERLCHANSTAGGVAGLLCNTLCPQCLAGWCVLLHLVAAWCTLHVVTKHSGAKSLPAASDTHMNMLQSVSITTGMVPIAGQTHSKTKYGSFDAGFARLSRTHTG